MTQFGLSRYSFQARVACSDYRYLVGYVRFGFLQPRMLPDEGILLLDHVRLEEAGSWLDPS